MRVRFLSGALLAALLLGSLGGAVRSDPLPALPSPGISAPGVDVPCKPSTSRPTPVVLIHGTRSDRTINWQYLGPELAALGFCVFSLDLPDRGQAPLAESVRALSRRVVQVLSDTGAKSVSFVGHSVGGIVARDMVLRGGGKDFVDDVIAMGTPHSGYYTEPPGDQVDAAFNTGCTSCYEQARGSQYMLGLNAGDRTPGRASYTSLITSYDGVSLPLESQYLPDGPEVTNVLLQDACPDHVVDHLTLAIDPLVRDWVVNALERHGPADQNRSVECAPTL